METKELELIILVSIASNMFVQLPIINRIRMMKYRYMKALKKDIQFTQVRIKPIDCETCLTFWTLIINSIFIQQLPIFNSLLFSLTGSWVSFQISKRFPKYA